MQLPDHTMYQCYFQMCLERDKEETKPNSGLVNSLKKMKLGAVAHVCDPSTLEGWGGWITRSRDRDHLGQHGETPSLLKIQKISWVWWHVPVIPVTQEAEAGELPESRRRRLQWAEIAPLHSSLGNKSKTPSQNKKKKIFLLNVEQDKDACFHHS